MSTPIKMPQLGESVVDGTVSRWLKSPGDAVEKLEPLLEVSTDKIDTEIPSPIGGILLEITVAEGETVDAGTVIGYIGDSGEVVSVDNLPADQEEQSDGNAKKTVMARPAGRDFVSPVVARIAAEHAVDITQIAGTGMGGRVTKKDLLAFIAERKQTGSRLDSDDQSSVGSQARKTQPAQPTSSGETAQSPHSEGRDFASNSDAANAEILHPLTTMRRAIAQHMVQSKATSPHVTTIFEADMGRVVQHREAEKTRFAERGVALNFTAYFVAATASALRAEPMVNSRFTEKGIIEQRRIHIGVAVAVDDGLLVPVLRDVDELNLQGVARGVQELSQKARSGQLTADALQGGTFTISNHGVGGSLVGTPIINQPQAGILGVGAIVKRPVVRNSSTSLLPSADDAIVIRPMCYISFTFDHRILDGAVADRFVMSIKETLENWT